MQIDLDAKRLRRPWWTTPLIMTGGLVAIFYSIAFVIVGMINSNQPYYRHVSVGEWPLYIGLFFGLCGMMWGRNFSSAAAATIGGRFGVKYLKPDHWLTQRVHKLAASLDLPPPSVGIVNVVNAFAMGPSPDKAAVVLGVPLVKGLSPAELDAVIGHELGHVISGDMTRMQFAEGYGRMFRVSFGVTADHANSAANSRATNAQGVLVAMVIKGVLWLFMALLNLSSQLSVKGLSRHREFFADAVGAAVASPEAMCGALRKLHNPNIETTPVETEYGCLMFKGAGSFSGLFSTHPTLESRIRALETRSHLNRLPLRRSQTTKAKAPKISEAPPTPPAVPTRSFDVARPEQAELRSPPPVFARPTPRQPDPTAAVEHPLRPSPSNESGGQARDAYQRSLAKMLSEIEQRNSFRNEDR